MREILFKAKRKGTGEWIEGFYCKYGHTKKEKHYIVPSYASDLYAFEIDAETIFQYTGLTDKNGNKIWENDIVRYTDEIINKEKVDLIEFNETHASFVRLHKSQMGLQYLYINEGIANKCEVIGNIFDNPELLEGGAVHE